MKYLCPLCWGMQPHLYTPSAFSQRLLPELPALALSVAGECWAVRAGAPRRERHGPADERQEKRGIGLGLPATASPGSWQAAFNLP